MKLETLSTLLNVSENKFFWTGAAAAVFYLVVLDTKIGEAMFGNWLEFITHCNSTIIWLMVIFSGRTALAHFSKGKKIIDNTTEGKDE